MDREQREQREQRFGVPADQPSHPKGRGELVSAHLDFAREHRKGIPEVIFAEVKTDDQVMAIVRSFLDHNGHAVVSRLRERTAKRLLREFPGLVDWRQEGRAASVHAPGYVRPSTGGRIGVLTAGTSDVPVAEEARLIAEEMGCEVATLYDVGVAGLHRLLDPLRALVASEISALVVCAGMDGALPSVVTGLVPVPVIGVPTSIGYGVGGKGRAALLSMLQTCAPGLTVVNIDNGIGAGATAALIANRIAAARETE